MRRSAILLSFLSFYLVHLGAQAATVTPQEFLRRFQANPKLAMDEKSAKVVDGVAYSRGHLSSESFDPQLSQAKWKLRQEIIKRSLPDFSRWTAITDIDQPALLVDGGVVVSNFNELDNRGLMQSKVDYEMWSDTWWPTQKGLLATRYADKDFPNSADWTANHNYYLEHPPQEILASGNSEAISKLSPAEKYDLLTGDPLMSLTTYSWKAGEDLLKEAEDGVVPGWIGICHGWSGATHMQQPIPYGAIDLLSASGVPITFYQSDVKALVSMLWARAYPKTKLIGSNCREKAPPNNSLGRPELAQCLDTNPATFFLTMANQLGINRRSFVMDATYDHEVWNFSVVSYKSTYFNPQTTRVSDNLSSSLIALPQFTADKFRQFRSANAQFVVGIMMDVTYLIEVSPTHTVQVKPHTNTNRYFFDLELDANKNVIGGEWYTRDYPDFLWTFERDAKAEAKEEAVLIPEDWSPLQTLPEAWKEPAQKAANRGIPLRSIIKRIVDEAPKAEVLPQ